MNRRHCRPRLARSARCCSPPAARPPTPAPAAPAERVATVNGKPLHQVRVRPVRRERRAASPAARSPKSRRRSCSISSSACSSRPRRPRRPASRRSRRCEDQLALARLNVLVDAGLQKYLEEHPVHGCGAAARIRRAGRRDAARISRAPHPGRGPGRGRGDHQGAEGRRRFRQARGKELQGLLRQERRRSRLVHARHDGQAVRRRRRSAAAGPADRAAGAEPVRLARHQARRIARDQRRRRSKK